jgi:hypothetical protein
MSFIPVFTPGNIGVPSQFVSIKNIPNPVFVSSYTGNILPGRPKFDTISDDPTRKNPRFHGGILIDDHTIMCHKTMHYGGNQGQRKRY